MVLELPADDAGVWTPQPPPSTTSSKRKKVSKPAAKPKPKAKCRGSSSSGLQLPSDDYGLDLPIADSGGACADGMGVSMDHGSGTFVGETPVDANHLADCEDSTLMQATMGIPSVVECPHTDLLDMINLRQERIDPTMRCHLWEIFTAPRVSSFVRAVGGRARRSFDLKHFWDLGETSFQRTLIQDIILLQPLFLMLSPPCTMVCQLQHSNWPRMKRKIRFMSLEEALHFIDLCMWIAFIQLSLGHFFALEHPAGSLIWSRESAPWFFKTGSFYLAWHSP